MNYKELLRLAVEAAFRAGEEIIKIYSTDFEVETKSDNTPVTLADKASGRCINGILAASEIPVISEEEEIVEYQNITLVVNYKPFKDFSKFYASVKDGNPKIVGLGSVSTGTEREKEVMFSPPYLRNVAVLITSGKVQTVKTKTAAEVSKVFSGLSAVGVNKSSHINYLNEIKKSYLPALNITYTENQNQVLEAILSDNSKFGYVDVIAYWSFLKSNPKFLKIQKVFNEPKETMGFIMPKKSTHAVYLSEFFESGFGFTSTKVYHQILEKYLGYEILESVEIK